VPGLPYVGPHCTLHLGGYLDGDVFILLGALRIVEAQPISRGPPDIGVEVVIIAKVVVVPR
jgi:hypothetical protein